MKFKPWTTSCQKFLMHKTRSPHGLWTLMQKQFDKERFTLQSRWASKCLELKVCENWKFYFKSRSLPLQKNMLLGFRTHLAGDKTLNLTNLFQFNLILFPNRLLTEWPGESRPAQLLCDRQKTKSFKSLALYNINNSTLFHHNNQQFCIIWFVNHCIYLTLVFSDRRLGS